MTVSAIQYQVNDLAAMERFYRDALGCEVTSQNGSVTCAFPQGARLEFHEAPVTQHEAAKDNRYWKIGLTMPDLDRAVAYLDRMGWPVSRPRQFLDIGYMCHLNDPAGLPIELLQQGFEGRAAAGPEGHDIGAQATLAHLTLRAETRAAADAEWCESAGMTLMSVQPVTQYGFSLYFFAKTHDAPPDPDLTTVANREWLWRRPYTLVEVQVYDDGLPITPVDEGMAGLSGIKVTP